MPHKQTKQQQKTSHAPSATADTSHASPQNTEPFAPVMNLQRVIGNQATRHILNTPGSPVIQRMPTVRAVKQALGEPHEDKKILGKVVSRQSTDYRAVLAALDTFNTFISNTSTSVASLQTLMGHYSTLETAINQYLANKTGKKKKGDQKVPYMQNLLAQLETERSMAGQIALQIEQRVSRYTNPDSMRPKWYISLSGKTPDILKNSEVVSQDKGGTNEVTEINRGGQSSFFKANQDSITLLQNFENQNKRFSDVANTTKAFKGYESGAIYNSYNVPADAGIFDEQQIETFQQQNRGLYELDINMQTSKRDVATSRLNELLGGNVIAKAELAFKRLDDGSLQMGSLMEKAKGKTLSKTNFDQAKTPQDGPQVRFEDPNFQRLLSRLQLMDALTGQVDRNMSNFYIETDNTGSVTGLTGIDNDMSFGKERKNLDRVFNFPGISRFVDAELAERIIAVNPEDVKAAVSGLITDDEITALLERLNKLKTLLSDLKAQNKLLQPTDWNALTAQGLLEEKTNYFTRAKNKISW
jgi:hypothetical protein